MKDLLIKIGKEDFENSMINRHDSVDSINFNYSEDFDTGCEEGYNIRVVDNNLRVMFLFECVASVTYKDGDTQDINCDYYELFVPIGYKTPKGYFSKKKVDVDFEYQNEEHLSISQALELMKFKTDAKINTFDPFWHENQSKMRNASAWNYIAQNYITDPYCTR